MALGDDVALLLVLSWQYLREARFRDSLLASARAGMLAGSGSSWRIKPHHSQLPEEVPKRANDSMCTPHVFFSSRMPQAKAALFVNQRRSEGKLLARDSPRRNAAPVSFNWTSMLEPSDEMKQTTWRLAAAQQGQQHDWGMTRALPFAACRLH